MSPASTASEKRANEHRGRVKASLISDKPTRVKACDLVCEIEAVMSDDEVSLVLGASHLDHLLRMADLYLRMSDA